MTHLAFHKVNNLLVCISVAMFASSLLLAHSMLATYVLLQKRH